MAGRLLLVLVGMSLALSGGIATRQAAGEGELSISGVIWEDANHDGVRQEGEDGDSHSHVSLVASSGPVAEVRTGAMGEYRFEGLSPGNYLVKVRAFGSRVMTYPEFQYAEDLVRLATLRDASLTGLDFGLHAPRSLPIFYGLAWINARPADWPDVRAFIGGKDCTGPGSIMPPDGDPARYQIGVLSAALKSGCGEPGSTISFTINDLPANEAAVWNPIPQGEAPFQLERGALTLTVGPPFANFIPSVREIEANGEVGPRYGYLAVAMIDGQVCTVGVGRAWEGVFLPVPSEELKPGCGRNGATVSFAVDGFAVPETFRWEASARDEFTFFFEPSSDAPLAGPRFAYYRFQVPRAWEEFIQAYVGKTHCARIYAFQSASESPQVVMAVPPRELLPGCGAEGALVRFEVNGEPFGEPVEWAPGFHDGPALPDATQEPAPDVAVLTGAGVIAPPEVGDAGLKAP